MVMGEPHIRPLWTRSLSQQVAFVECNLEFHLGANHLIENAFALLVAGLFFRGTTARRWERKGLELLTDELDKQALPDGGHVERSVSYHVRANQVCREALGLLQANRRPVSQSLRNVHDRMSSFTTSLRHCDGNVPLFHDAQWIEDADWNRFDSLDSRPRLERPNQRSFDLLEYPASGYYILDQPAGRLIADYGAPGSSDNPGHQHAGIFSYEISCEKGRVIVDTGTSSYGVDAERDHLRGTSAHNTVTVDETNQFVVWEAFRIGRRAFVHDVEVQSGPGWHRITAWHDGYKSLGVTHRRSILGLEGIGWLVVDLVEGSGLRTTESFIHLHPQVVPGGIEPQSEAVALTPPGWSLAAIRLPGLQIKPDHYSTRLGERQPSRTLFVSSREELPLSWAYWIAPFSPEQVRWDVVGKDIFVLTAPEKQFRVNLSEAGHIEITLEI